MNMQTVSHWGDSKSRLNNQRNGSDSPGGGGPTHAKTCRLVAALGFMIVYWSLCLPALGQYSIDWYKVSGGGGSSTGGVYSVSGTIGQPDTGVMSGGDYSLTGGFWSLISVVQTPVAPLLSLKLTGNTVMVYWPSPSTGFSPQVNTNLATTNWVPPAETVQDNGSIKYLLISPPAGNRFYRLKNP